MFKKCISEKLSYVFSDLEVCLFKYLKIGISKKWVQVVVTFVSLLFKYLKGVPAKSCARFFQICKFAFLNI